MHNSSNPVPEFTYRELSQVIRISLRSEHGFQPLLIKGAPGAGKTYFATHVFRQLVAEHHGCEVDDVHVITEKPARREFIDIAGVTVPAISEGDDPARGLKDGEWYGETTVPALLMKIRKAFAKGAVAVVLVLDELLQAGQSERKALTDLLDPDEGTIGGYAVPDNTYTLATANRTSDKSGSFKAMAMETNRIKEVEVVVPMEHWIQDYAKPKGLNPVMIDIAASYPEDTFAAEVPAEDGPFCTARSFTRCAGDLTAFMESPDFTGVIPRWFEKAMHSMVGKNVAARIVEYIARRDEVPEGREILANPEGAMVPQATGWQLLAANLALAEVDSVQDAEAALAYIMRLRTDLQVSLGVKLMHRATNQGWFVGGAGADKFLADFQQYLPLAYGELGLD